MTTLVNDRHGALLVGYAATDWSIDLPFEAYEQVFDDWIVQALMRDQRYIGAVFTKGEELHVSILPNWRGRWLSKGLLRSLLGGRKVTTRVAPGHDFMYPILFRLGFKPDETGMLVKE